MTLAVSALDVAFVAALVGLAAPLSAWLIARETRRGYAAARGEVSPPEVQSVVAVKIAPRRAVQT